MLRSESRLDVFQRTDQREGRYKGDDLFHASPRLETRRQQSSRPMDFGSSSFNIDGSLEVTVLIGNTWGAVDMNPEKETITPFKRRDVLGEAGSFINPLISNSIRRAQKAFDERRWLLH